MGIINIEHSWGTHSISIYAVLSRIQRQQTDSLLPDYPEYQWTRTEYKFKQQFRRRTPNSTDMVGRVLLLNARRAGYGLLVYILPIMDYEKLSNILWYYLVRRI